MKIFPVRDGRGQRKRAHCVPAAGSPHFLSNNKQPSSLSALSGRQWLTVGQGPAGCIDPVLYIYPHKRSLMNVHLFWQDRSLRCPVM